MSYHVPHFIQGEKFHGLSGRKRIIHNPATGEEIGEVDLGDYRDVEEAVKSAKNAFPSWAATSPIRRARVLFKFKALLEENIQTLAELVTQEHGKLIDDAKGSISRGIELVEYACGIPALLSGRFSENVATDIDTYSVRQPLGVCMGVTPFNFPVMVPIWMLVNAIACGNTFILKPSEQDPSPSLMLAELMKKAGLPAGVLNVVNGDKETVDALLLHPDIQAVSAVASTPVAQAIYLRAIGQGKRAHTFGGAKNHCVVMPDVDIDEAAETLLGAAYGSAGERCMAISVAVVVGEETADALVERLSQKLQSLRVGPGTEKDSQMGPLISQAHKERVNSYVEKGLQEGADLVVDRRNLDEKGFFLGPCLFDHVTPSMHIYQEEIFGPVLCMVRVNSLDEAIDLINQNRYGNGTAILTQDGAWARQFAKEVQVGMVGINIPIPVPISYHSFGGWKQSSFGDIGMHGDQSIQFYTRIKTITSSWRKRKNTKANYAMTSHG